MIRLIFVIVLKEKKDRKSRSIFAGHFFNKFLAIKDVHYLETIITITIYVLISFFNSAGIDTK